MATVHLPSTLRSLADGEEQIELPGDSAAEVLHALEQRFPRLAGWVLDESGGLRPHVALFVDDRRVPIDAALAPGDQMHVVPAISGGAVADTGELVPLVELLVGTRKGLFVLRGTRGRALEASARRFPGQTVDFACRDRRSGRYFAAITHGQYGPRLYFTDDPHGEWLQADGPVFPEDAGASVSRIWVVEPGEGAGELWAGVAPAALFRSTDDGESWSLVRGLWDEPTRPRWEGGLGGLCLHSVCPWPGEPRRLAVAVSAAGVWLTEDGGESWRRGVEGLVPRYIPEEARRDTLTHCVHSLRRAPLRPERLYMQFHGGVYRSDDTGASWQDIAHLGRQGGLPADFGFPLAIDPHDPERAFVIPLVSDADRVTPDGRLRVYETRDGGGRWHPLERGLPQQDAYLTVLRQAFCHDGGQPLGLYFGAESGEVFASADGGETWSTAAEHLPPITSVRPAY